jgi:hypothetical protein
MNPESRYGLSGATVGRYAGRSQKTAESRRTILNWTLLSKMPAAMAEFPESNEKSGS